MLMFSRRLIFFIFVMAMTLIFGLETSYSATRQVLNRSNSAEPATLDPHTMVGVPESNIARDLFEGLVTEDRDGNIVPGVAQRWDISKDGLIYTFYLNPQARWSNGDPLTSADFVYSLRRAVAPLTASPYANFLYPIKNAQLVNQNKKPLTELGVQAIDATTLQITLESPTAYFLASLPHSTMRPVHQKTVEQYGGQFTQPGHLISNGPYQLKDWIVNAAVQLEKNPYYWNKEAVHIETVNWIPIVDGAAMVRMYQGGQVDITTSIPSNQYKRLKALLHDEVTSSPMLATAYYFFNLDKAPFKDNLKLRQALTMALDRNIITEQVLGKGEIPLYADVPPNTDNIDVKPYDWATSPQNENIAKAKELYVAAGYSKENPLKFTLIFNTLEDQKKLALAVASLWKQTLGVEVIMENQEWKVLLDNRRQGNFTMARGGWVADYNDPTTFLNLFLCNNIQNYSHVCDPVFEELMDKAAKMADPKERRALLTQAHTQILKSYAIVPLYILNESYLIKPYVKGFSGKNPLQHVYTKDLYFVKD